MSLDVKKTTKISIFYLLHYSMYKTLVNKGLDPIHPGAFIHSSLILHTTLMIYVLYNWFLSTGWIFFPMTLLNLKDVTVLIHFNSML